MEVAIFAGSNRTILEDDINDFLKTLNDVKSFYVTQSQSETENGMSPNIIISIFFK